MSSSKIRLKARGRCENPTPTIGAIIGRIYLPEPIRTKLVFKCTQYLPPMPLLTALADSGGVKRIFKLLFARSAFSRTCYGTYDIVSGNHAVCCDIHAEQQHSIFTRPRQWNTRPMLHKNEGKLHHVKS